MNEATVHGTAGEASVSAAGGGGAAPCPAAGTTNGAGPEAEAAAAGRRAEGAEQRPEGAAETAAERSARAMAAMDAARWQAQAAEAAEAFPGLDLRAELRDPRFGRLLLGGFDVATAYVALHHRELIPQVMRYAAEEAGLAAAEAIREGRARPAENGAQGASAAPVRPDVRAMSRAQREELIARARRGEKVRL